MRARYTGNLIDFTTIQLNCYGIKRDVNRINQYNALTTLQYMDA